MIKDPVCGMEIDPMSAFASRDHMGQAYYFCSENCVKQFDQNPHQYAQPGSYQEPEAESVAGSVTTGFNPTLQLAQVELPIVGLKKDGQAGASLIKTAMEKHPGVEKAVVSTAEGVAVIQYDPDQTKVLDLIGAVKKIGYQVGGAQKRIGIEDLHCASCVM